MLASNIGQSPASTEGAIAVPTPTSGASSTPSFYMRMGWSRAPPSESIDSISERPAAALELEGELSIMAAPTPVLKDDMN